jgi:DNA-binding GntR family transcriptional regulator
MVRCGGVTGRQERELVTGVVGQPAYQLVAGELRAMIAAGELAVGAAIPSTTELMRRYEVSSTVARAAVGQLRADGLVVGQPGKGVFVRATPGEVADRVVSVEHLAREVALLREQVDAERGRREALEREVGRLRRKVEGGSARAG